MDIAIWSSAVIAACGLVVAALGTCRSVPARGPSVYDIKRRLADESRTVRGRSASRFGQHPISVAGMGDHDRNSENLRGVVGVLDIGASDDLPDVRAPRMQCDQGFGVVLDCIVPSVNRPDRWVDVSARREPIGDQLACELRQPFGIGGGDADAYEFVVDGHDFNAPSIRINSEISCSTWDFSRAIAPQPRTTIPSYDSPVHEPRACVP